jgi:hypothetical protein
MNYEVVGKVKGKVMTAEGNGNNISGEAANILRNCDVGSKLYIDATIKGPDGKTSSTTCGIKVTR